jgi:2-dehydropantoate 2-reductase
MTLFTSKIRIVIAGIGGVGGYFGGQLARHYEKNNEAEIIFFARGENEKAIRQNGLKVESTIGEFIAKPKLVTSDASEIGKADFLIICTKSYDLEQTLLQLSPCINESTVILPLLNGIDNYEKTKNCFPKNEVWQGCVYIVSRLINPGIIKQMGNKRLLFFGSKNGNSEKLKQLETIFLNAGIEAYLSKEIEQTIWEKFLFISSIATMTSYMNTSVGLVLSHSESKSLLLTLLAELKKIAEAKQIILPENIIEIIMNKLRALPADITSSMHTDFQKGKLTELDSLTGIVVKLGRQYGVATPTYEKLYNELRGKIDNNLF